MKNSPETLAKRNALKAHWKEVISLDTFPKIIKRVCKDCGEYKDCSWNYTFSSRGAPEYRARCIDCFKKYSSKIQKSNRIHISNHHKETHQVRKQKAIAYLGGECCVCGYDKCAAALTFHHTAPEEKEFAVTTILDWSWDNIVNELDKCELMCFNCHMELHDRERNK